MERQSWRTGFTGSEEDVVQRVAFENATVCDALIASFSRSRDDDDAWKASWITLWDQRDPTEAGRVVDGRLTLAAGANAYAYALVGHDHALTSIYAMLMRRELERSEENINSFIALIQRGEAALRSAARGATLQARCEEHRAERRTRSGVWRKPAPALGHLGYDLPEVCAACTARAILAAGEAEAVRATLEFQRPLGGWAFPRDIDAFLSRLAPREEA